VPQWPAEIENFDAPQTETSWSDHLLFPAVSATSSAVWPTASTAIFMPFICETKQNVKGMSFFVTTASGNYDVGIYDENGVRRASKGSTVVPAAGFAFADFTDTDLEPGCYWMAMAVDNITASFHASNNFTAQMQRIANIYAQAAAFVLPSSITYSNWATAYFPLCAVHTVVP
jgi:hypothetical protein